MAALPLNRRISNSRRSSSGIRIPAWAIARRFSQQSLPSSGGSPDSLAKKTVSTIPCDDDDDSLALPRMNSNTVVLQMDVTGFAAVDLHLELDLPNKRVCLAGKGPRMFKRSFPLAANTLEQIDVEGLQALFVSENGRTFLRVQAPQKTTSGSSKEEEAGAMEETDSIESGRRNIPITTEAEANSATEARGPPTMITVRN